MKSYNNKQKRQILQLTVRTESWEQHLTSTSRGDQSPAQRTHAVMTHVLSLPSPFFQINAFQHIISSMPAPRKEGAEHETFSPPSSTSKRSQTHPHHAHMST